jgi:hypothetical protein
MGLVTSPTSPSHSNRLNHLRNPGVVHRVAQQGLAEAWIAGWVRPLVPPGKARCLGPCWDHGRGPS